MPKLRISALEGHALLDVASYARRGPGRRDRLSLEEVALIGRTLRRTPEVMVKVLAKDSNNLRSVVRHLNYIGRHGQLQLEADDERVQGRNAGQQLVEGWDLDLDQDRRDLRLAAGTGRAPKLVHKIMLSMPPGTSEKGVLEAARNFGREQFALKHRYALVLHADEPHPHVHMVIKAVSETGERLNIRKATLREWRREFARHLRDQGIAANATERAVRGESRTHKRDQIYRAAERGESSHIRKRAEIVISELYRDNLRIEAGKTKMINTRTEVEEGWRAISGILSNEGKSNLAAEVMRFVDQLAPPRTEKEQIAAKLLQHVRWPPTQGRSSQTR